MKQYQNKLEVFCETLKNPIGIDNPNPRFSWHPHNSGVTAAQKSYRVVVYEAKGYQCVWDSGNIECSDSIAIRYAGEKLESFGEYSVEVEAVLDDGAVYRGSCRFEMGILSREEWAGDFLCHPAYQKRSSPLFISDVNISGKVKKCRAYFCGLGYGELYVNGDKTDDSMLDPAWTDYNRRILYRTYDITESVQEGINRFRIVLGDGWMAHNHQYFETSRKPPLPWYHEPCFLLNLRIEYENGRVETFEPDQSNCRANFSEITSQNLFDGEIYDAIRAKELQASENGALTEADGWVTPAVTQMSGVLTSQVMPPIKVTEIIRPVGTVSTDPSVYIVDMGINFSGVVRIKVAGEKGSSVQLRHAEVAREDGNINQENLRYAQASDTYILCGDPMGETYMPRFTYHGFRFVEIRLNGKAKVLDVEGMRVNSAVERIGHFSCSDPMLNSIYKMLINTEVNNLHSLPTDCPQRDERLAWLNDAMMRLEQNVMNFDSQLFFEKWLRDMRDTQKKVGTGAVPDTCPYYYGMSPARWNASVFVALPYAIYLYYGDSAPVSEHWESVLWYMEFQKSKLTEEGLIKEFYVGEWCPPMKDSILEDRQSAFARDIKNQLATSCFYYLECRICERMATLLGRNAEAEDFASRAEQVKEAVNFKYFDKEKGTYLPECQGNLILPLYLDMVPDGFRDQVAECLVSYIVGKDHYHISTGSHTTRFLFETLSKIGRDDLALKMLHVKSYPSFGYMLENGATSLWERWEKTFGFMTSHNHPMSGGFGVWFLKVLGGICVDSDDPARLLVSPHVPDGIYHVNCDRTFRNGRAVSNWYKVGDEVHYDITVPWNMTAQVKIECSCAAIEQVEINGEKLSLSGVDYRMADGCLLIDNAAGYLHIRVMKR